ncbi:Protein kinase domain-containing protein [Stigmatella aurantiaca]|uniref:Protein kinase domain-containing protein n=1 Tax=Stigmatella aurantiaca TaxID=41 RepID=A0A1H7JZG2_STIAU|nr:serine/threonine-protein kinase [Stigmatella aurantiaca]SEK79872.1 Protein kinase domain-containing protein [Stigmatella aurantiaca]
MSSQSSSASIPLTSQHQGGEEPEFSFDWKERYKQLDYLGEGGFAEVFKARDLRTGENVAIKVSKSSGGDLRRFSREVAILQALRDEHVIEILDAGENWYTMPLADGNLMNLAPELCDEERIKAVIQAAKGLAAVHAAGWIHRDVTPNNILRIEERWVVSDFGLVRKPHGMSSVPRTRGILGTHGYMAPEVILKGAHDVTKLADIFSLGQVVGFITTGNPPPRIGEQPQVPRIWENLVEKMTAMTISERFQSMDELQPALLEVWRRLKEQRKAEWSARRAAAEAVDELSQAEQRVVARILQEPNDDFREHEILDAMPRSKRGSFKIGLIALKRRDFIEINRDESGRPWGYRLTEAAHDWIVANPDFLDAFPPSELETPQDDMKGDDDIPF